MTPKTQHKIVVLDDDKPIIEALQLALTTFGFVTKTITKSSELSPLLKKFQPDLLIIDFFLAGESGADLVTKVRQSTKNSKLKIIMFSAHPSAKDEVDPGLIDAFIAKPFDINTLVRKIQTLLA